MPRYSKFSAKTPKKNSNLIRENAHILGYHLKPKLGLQQFNYVSFVKKQVFTIRESKISESNALVKAIGLTLTPCSVKIVGTVTFFHVCPFKLWLSTYRNRGEIAQSLHFEYLYKGHCKSCELLWVLYNMVFLKSPQQFAGFALTLVKIFKAKALCNFTPPCAKPPRLTVLTFWFNPLRIFDSLITSRNVPASPRKFRDRLTPPNWSFRKPLFTTKFNFSKILVWLGCFKVWPHNLYAR